MNSKIVAIFLISFLCFGLTSCDFTLYYLYDYKEKKIRAERGIISFKLFGTWAYEYEPKKIARRTNPYSFRIKYTSKTPFNYAVISNLKFMSHDEGKLIFEHVEKKDEANPNCYSRDGDVSCAGFFYSEVSHPIKLEYIDYLVKGTITIYGFDGKSIVMPFEAVLEKDYTKKYTSDLWECLTGC